MLQRLRNSPPGVARRQRLAGLAGAFCSTALPLGADALGTYSFLFLGGAYWFWFIDPEGSTLSINCTGATVTVYSGVCGNLTQEATAADGLSMGAFAHVAGTRYLLKLEGTGTATLEVGEA